MIIRKSMPQDLDALELLFQTTRRKTFTTRRADEFNIGDYQKSVADDEVWVAQKNGKIVGFVSIYRADNFIHNLFVHPDWQGQAIGGLLLKKAEDNLAYPMTLKIALDNVKVAGFYEKYGWTKVSDHEDAQEPYMLYSKNVVSFPFSFQELDAIPEFQMQEPFFVNATDGVKLAYYPFLPTNPQAVCILYHGGGLYSNRTYQYIGWELQEKYNVATYCVDIRGHGQSGGERGDAPSVQQVLDDITTVLIMVKEKFPESSVYLVGHSSGAGLLLNYSTYARRADDLLDGYIFLAPYLGPFAGANRPDAVSFVKKVRVWIYLLNQLFKIPLFQHIPAVYFNYPREILKQDPLIVNQYTYTMSCATTPHEPKRIFELLSKPATIFIGAHDEQFIPEKVVEYAHYNKHNCVKAEVVPNAKHLSILLQAPVLIARAVKGEK